MGMAVRYDWHAELPFPLGAVGGLPRTAADLTTRRPNPGADPPPKTRDPHLEATTYRRPAACFESDARGSWATPDRSRSSSLVSVRAGEPVRKIARSHG